MLSSSTYNTRYFVLDVSNRILRYYKDDKPSTPESGTVNMNDIIDVQLSQVYDAPEFSLDLISNERHYTVVADSHASMVRWAFAFNLARKKDKHVTSSASYSPGSMSSPVRSPSAKRIEYANRSSQSKLSFYKKSSCIAAVMSIIID